MSHAPAPNEQSEQQLSADFTQHLSIDTRQLPWQSSPAPGVLRRRLEWVGAPPPQLTTIVRFEPGSHFSEHTHGGGEELLILSGVFSDDSGDFAAGSYVRNPPGSRHTPHSNEGCTLLVKLRQFQVSDSQQKHVNTRDDDAFEPLESGINCSQLRLHEFADEQVRYLRMGTDSWLPPMPSSRGVEIFVVAGSVSVDGQTYGAGYWLRRPIDSNLSISSASSCELWIKEGPAHRFRATTPRGLDS